MAFQNRSCRMDSPSSEHPNGSCWCSNLYPSLLPPRQIAWHQFGRIGCTGFHSVCHRG
ncbi:Uncharacterised protein [Vibrio cholerae]|nr:Uncharacterised protein [Vibrio cholerae]